jgi:hypothetical protein
MEALGAESRFLEKTGSTSYHLHKSSISPEMWAVLIKQGFGDNKPRALTSHVQTKKPI